VSALLLHSLSWSSTCAKFGIYVRVTARHCHTHARCERSATTPRPCPAQSTYLHTQPHPSTPAFTSRDDCANALQPIQICLASLVPALPRYAGHQADKPLEVTRPIKSCLPSRASSIWHQSFAINQLLAAKLLLWAVLNASGEARQAETYS
jgi:hypothetical protein